MSQPTKKPPFEVVLREDGALEVIDPSYREPTPDEIAEKKRNSARCGHIKRRILRDESLTGELLDFAVSIAGEDSDIAKKLRARETLSDHESYVMVDVLLVHKRLSG